MINFVVVSHNKKLVDEAIRLASIMKFEDFKIVNAGGFSDSDEFGTDTIRIMEAINSVLTDDGVIVFCELGSSLMNSQMAIEMIANEKVVIANAPLVEGLVVGVSSNNKDAILEDLINEIEEINTLNKKL